MTLTDFKRQEGENELQYIWRLGRAKESGLLEADWDEIAKVVNVEFRTDESEYRAGASYRKPYQCARAYYDQVFAMMKESPNEDYERRRKELEKERVLLRDERTDYNRRMREEARLEAKLEYLGEIIQKTGRQRYEIAERPAVVDTNNGEEMIAVLSDMHIGAEYYSMNGAYNPDIAKSRVKHYADEIERIQQMHHVSRCHVAILGDDIEGVIHQTIRIQAAENVIDQVKDAVALICDFLARLSGIFDEIDVISVSGNHSRLDPKKDNSLKDEKLDNLIFWCAENMLRHIKNVKFLASEDTTFAIELIQGRNYVFVHGDRDAFTDSGIGKLSLMLGFVPYAVVAGHKHYPALSEVNGVKVVRSGSLAGSGGDYCVQNRLQGKPSQTILVVNGDGIKAHYSVLLGGIFG